MNQDFLDSITSVRASILIDRAISRTWRRRVIKGFVLLTAASFVVSVFEKQSFFDGVALFSFGLTILSLSFEFFYNSSRFSEIPSEYSVALVTVLGEDADATRGFISSVPGRVLMFRLGISGDEIVRFLSSARERINEFDLKFDSNSISFSQYAAALYEKDKALESFVASRGVSGQEFNGAAEWIGKELLVEEKIDRWWSREHLGSIPSIGTSLDYGGAYELSRFSHPLGTGADLLGIPSEAGYRAKEVSQLENILSRTEEANALIVDDDESVAEGILLLLLKKIRWGTAPAILEHTHIMRLDWNLLVAERADKHSLESELLSLLRETESAGDRILYIPNLPSFMAGVKPLGVDVPSLLQDFMHSLSLHIIAHSTKADFHYLIESNGALTRLFERLIPEEAGVAASMPPLVERARIIEARYPIFFSYPGLLAIAESADRYIPYGEMPSKAINLLIEIVPWAVKRGLHTLSKKDVGMFVSSKTGIAAGDVNKEEADKLGKLESLLHARIVGQDEAVKAVASAMRRARSGITSPKRPFASFLFLGPTGVGKTETSKALAASFFGGEEKMIRFDMSQYKEADALPTLVGSAASNTPGLLSSKVRDNPYGVLLLDEFEKASPDVRDLFLQVLDEGEFVDATGAKVNCRNMIIIATSNAGSSLIWDMVENKKDLNANKDKIIDSLIADRIMKPELLNRFDGVIIFHPLEDGELVQVAQKTIEALVARVKKDKQIDLIVTPEFVQNLINQNQDKEFGGRAINRLVQEKIEDVLATKIISGEIKAGDSLEIK